MTPEEKAAKRAEKKARYGQANAQRSLPVVEVRVPWVTDKGTDIDLEKPPWDSLVGSYTNRLVEGTYRVRIVRT